MIIDESTQIGLPICDLGAYTDTVNNNNANAIANNNASNTNAQSNIWGQLKRKGVSQDDISLIHRVQDGRRDTYLIGRSKGADVIIEDIRVSLSHCLIYCDYSQSRLRMFIEDCSANGTYVNDSLIRLTKGERMELKSGYEIFLVNPRNLDPLTLNMVAFTFINIRERLLAQREVQPGLLPNNNKNQNLKWVDDRIPHIEDSYIIGDQIGSGMCGQVYFCVNRFNNMKYAVKIIDTRRFSLTSPTGLSVNDLKEEVEMMGQLDHPNIIKIVDNFQTEHCIYIVMEYVQGGDLFDRITERGKYSEENSRQIMIKILQAVKYLHSKRIIHRDLKPENILLVDKRDDINIKLTDFGLAKQASQDGLKYY